MRKKLTLSEAAEKLHSYLTVSEKLLEEIEASSSEIPEYPIENYPVISYRYMKDAVDMRHCYCPVCKNEWDEEYRSYSSYSWRRSSEKICPRCCNSALYDFNPSNMLHRSVGDLLYIAEVNETQGYIVFLQLKMDYVYQTPSVDVSECVISGDYSFLKGSFVKNFKKIEVHPFIFMLDKGFRVMSKDSWNSKMLKNGSSDSDQKIRDLIYRYNPDNLLSHNLPEALALLNTTWYSSTNKTTLFKVMEAIHKDIQTASEKAAAKRAVKPAEELKVYSEYEPEKLDLEAIAAEHGKSAKLLINRYGNISEYIVYCANCKTVSKITITDSGRAFGDCPNCGEELDISGYYYGGAQGSTSDSYKFKRMELHRDTGDLLLRVFDVVQTFSIDKSVKYEVKEKIRVFYTPKKIICLNNNDGVYEKGTAYDMDVERWNEKDNLFQTKEEVTELISNSTMKYSGLAEAWGLVDGVDAIDIMGNINRSSYIYNWYKRPCMEQLIKTGLYKAATDVLKSDNDRIIGYGVSPKETNIYDILNITKPVFKIARRRNLGLYDINYLRRFWEFDHTITETIFDQIRNLGSMDAIFDIANRYNIPFVKIIEYIDSCYNNQCIERNEAIRLWADYLRMAKDMTYRLDNKNTKFPQSLKKEHDRATFSYKVVQDEMNRKRFVEQAKENQKYEYSFEKLMVKVPKTPEEIVEEGTNQKHCVASYVNRVREGDTVVAFIRYKETPNESYFTIEIKDDRIVQVRGYTNCAPTDPKLLEFLRKFATAKKLKLAYH